MRPSLALELAGELSNVLRSTKQALSKARISQIPHAAVRAPYATRSFSGSAFRLADNGTTSTHQIRQTPASPKAPAPATAYPTPTSTSAQAEQPNLQSLTEGLKDPPPTLNEGEKQIDWSRSFHGMSSSPFSAEQIAILTAELPYDDIEIKPDGIVYLPEIKYRRILNKAFGPGGWGLAPRGETIVTGKLVTREYGLVAGGRLVSVARGEQSYFDPDGIPTATEGCKSNALMRCCKDLGVASELWDPRFIRKFLKSEAKECMVEHMVSKKRRKHWMRKDDELRWPMKEVTTPVTSATSNGFSNGFKRT
ncbi:mitochondrial genome maintenance MGM101-domain-containing protein [Delphinella strobiligena]|nr:mitochondrial genome maintenance MGM101-domain-containing protein [Delphinella strobiligena]